MHEIARQRLLRYESDETSVEASQLRYDAMIWQDGPYGKAWAANIRDIPRPHQFLSCIIVDRQEHVYARYFFRNLD